jgi:SAM-dependent methyltransferase
MNSTPGWKKLVANQTDWIWRNGRLFHRDVPDSIEPPKKYSWLHQQILSFCYASHNDSPKVRQRISALCAELTDQQWGLNVGAGFTSLHPQIINLDISAASSVHVVARGQELPFADNSLKLAISQEVIEHLPDPQVTIREVLRVLEVGGKFYCQAPFIIGYHPGPTDFWRFTKEGMAQLFSDRAWEILDLDTSVGHGTGAYRILVECFAVTASLLHRSLYIPFKGLFAILLTPIKLLDFLSDRSPQKHRIPGGYFCIVKKVAVPFSR